MVQRGEREFHMIEERADREIRHASFSEQVLVPPQVVQGTSAARLLPGLQKGIPTDLHMWSEEAMHELMECIDCFVFLPLGDRASSNVSIMKMWGYTWLHHFKDTYQVRVMYLAETCQVHSHHRTKVALADLKKHIARHHSLAHLYRLPSVLMQAANSLVAYVHNNFQRQACPPTAEAIEANKLWRTFFDVLYDLSSTAHDRASGKRAQRIEDIEDFLSRAFARPGSSSFHHHCWDTATNKPCCSSKEVAMQASLASTTNPAMGAAEKIPSESRWTNLTSSFRKTLVRRVTCPTSSLDFTGPASLAVEPGSLDSDDGAAMGNFLQSLNGVRAFRGRKYLSDARKFWEMGVLTVVLGVADKLLFALLGGADREEVPCTMQQLLGQGESPISKVMAEMLSLLEDWVGDPLRKPWMILDILGAPMECADFIRWARAQILLVNSALMRRYECRYGLLPFCFGCSSTPRLAKSRSTR